MGAGVQNGVSMIPTFSCDIAQAVSRGRVLLFVLAKRLFRGSRRSGEVGVLYPEARPVLRRDGEGPVGVATLWIESERPC